MPPTYAGSWGVSIARNWCNGHRCGYQALFFDVMGSEGRPHSLGLSQDPANCAKLGGLSCVAEI